MSKRSSQNNGRAKIETFGHIKRKENNIIPRMSYKYVRIQSMKLEWKNLHINGKHGH